MSNHRVWVSVLTVLVLQITVLARKICVETVKHLRFYTRLPVPRLSYESDPYAPPDFSVSVRSLPLAAAIIAMPSAIFIGWGAILGLSSALTATLVVGISALTTGAFHEDGLADTADSVGGGYSVEKRLIIMRDSRIGTYGSVALIIIFLLKIFAIIALIDTYGSLNAALTFMCAAIASRVAGILPHMFLASARADGKSADVKKPEPFSALIALIVTVVFCFVSLHSFGAFKIICAFCMIALLVFMLCLWSKRKIKGQTGDILGAIQQVSEAAFCVVLSANTY